MDADKVKKEESDDSDEQWGAWASPEESSDRELSDESSPCQAPSDKESSDDDATREWREVRRLRASVGQLRRYRDRREGRILELKRATARLETDKARLETNKARLESDKAMLETDKARLELDKAMLEADKARLRGERQTLEGRVKELEDWTGESRLRRQKETLEGRVRELEETVRQSRISLLREKQALEGRVRQLKEQLDESSESWTRLLGEKQTLEGRVKELDESHETFRRSRTRLLGEKQELEDRVKELEKELDVSLESWISQTQKLEGRVKDWKETAKQCRSHAEKALENWKETIDKGIEVAGELKRVRNRQEEQMEEIASLKTDRTLLLSEKEALEVKVRDLRSDAWTVSQMHLWKEGTLKLELAEAKERLGKVCARFEGSTAVKFEPPTGTDTFSMFFMSAKINTRHQCITAMAEYESKSMEELRWEDHEASRNKLRAERKVASVKETVCALGKKTGRLEDKLKQLEERASQSLKYLDAAAADVKRLEDQNAELAKDKEALEEKIASEEKDKAETQAELDAERGHAQVLVTENSQHLQMLEKVQSAVQEMKSEDEGKNHDQKTDCLALVEDSAAIIRELEEKNSELLRGQKNLLEKIGAVEAEKVELSDKVSSLRVRLARETESNLEVARAEQGTRKLKESMLVAMDEVLVAKVLEAEGELAETRTCLAAEREMRDQAEAEASDRSTRLRLAEERLADADESTQLALADAAEMKNEVSTMTGELRAARERLGRRDRVESGLRRLLAAKSAEVEQLRAAAEERRMVDEQHASKREAMLMQLKRTAEELLTAGTEVLPKVKRARVAGDGAAVEEEKDESKRE